MIRRPPRSTRTDTLFPYTTLFRSSYGAIAAFLGTRRSARMVGWAMNAAGTAIPPVPAHRVVNREGMLSGKHHFGTPNLMQELLESEGIHVVNDQVQRFQKYFWDPAQEL